MRILAKSLGDTLFLERKIPVVHKYKPHEVRFWAALFFSGTKIRVSRGLAVVPCMQKLVNSWHEYTQKKTTLLLQLWSFIGHSWFRLESRFSDFIKLAFFSAKIHLLLQIQLCPFLKFDYIYIIILSIDVVESKNVINSRLGIWISHQSIFVYLTGSYHEWA